jgi:2-C-methyl-D-erythritol 4-phosphate cytidylyltransferase
VRYWLVMPAAGSSQRFGGAQHKQFAPLAGTTVLDLALRPFLADQRCAGAALVLAAGQLERARIRCGDDLRLLRVAGGARRCDSVLCGLAALAPRAAAADWVLVHDAARPCLSAADLEQLLAAGQGHAVGALLATRVSDTIKQAGKPADSAQSAVCSEQTIDRELLWQAQTPQMFRYAALCAALRGALAAGRAPTDEAQAFEWLAAKPLLVPARFSNIKITTAEDLVIAGALLAARAAAKGET